MKIVFDIMHPAHINFFKNTIERLENNGDEVMITVLNRGKVPSIVKNELSNKNVHIIGRHRGTLWSILFEANVLRFFHMLYFVIKHKPNLGLSVGSFILGGNLKLLGRLNYQFDDDPERFFNVLLEKITSTRLFFPLGINSDSKKVENFKCLKEWAYLSPKYFVPNEGALSIFNVEKHNYIFVREVSSGSLNYMHQDKNLIASISEHFPVDIKVLLSLEDKSAIKHYPKDWILLQEPVMNIHSIMYFSKLVISSGDSMAREGAMLGIPSIYCGSRIMHANSVLIEKGHFVHTNLEDAGKLIEKIALMPFNNENQLSIREELYQEWDDINELIFKSIKKDFRL